MRFLKPIAAIVVLSTAFVSSTVALAQDSSPGESDGFKPIFDGKTLNGWDGDSSLWSVKDGVITGTTTPETKLKKNSFLIWRDGTLDDFELRLDYRIVNGNSGIQYRSRDMGGHVVGGYQADFEAGTTYSGILYEERGRGILAQRGTKVRIDADGKKKVVEKLGDSAEIQKKIKSEQWNSYRIVAKGNHLIHEINGVRTAEVIDDQKARRAMTGILALQIHVGPPMVVQFKNVRIKRLPLTDGRKKVVLVAGRQSHAPGDHEHNAGVLLLAKCLNQHPDEFVASAIVNHSAQNDYHDRWGWPKDPSAFDNADTVVWYLDGGGNHTLHKYGEQFQKVMDRGVGLVCLHYAVEIPKGPSGNRLLDWMGGYFEMNWSVNPHWDLKEGRLAKHEITNGVKPITANDEWYFHMRFRPMMKNVTPILQGLPPDETKTRRFGTHSGNPHVRKRLGLEEVVAWAAERPNGGRGFGFTGGHRHSNWGNEDIRKLVVNAIAWTAKAKVPEKGIESKVLTEDLQENLDPKGQRRPRRPAPKPTGKKKFQSKVLNKGFIDIDVNIAGAKKLFLVVTDGGDGYGCDHADWCEPRLEGPKGSKKLTDLKWTKASSGWGTVQKNKAASGAPMRVGGKAIEYGIGTHANSVIEYALPAGYTKFKARGGLDNGGTDQGCGNTVTFEVYTDTVPKKVSQRIKRSGNSGALSPEEGLELIDVHEELELTLFAHEPMLSNPTNLDIDSRGRVWVTEGVNYRRWKDLKSDGDRIVILEDTDLDGKADKAKTFYQDQSINSALGICVLEDGKGGTRVIVSCSPNIFVFTDADGDDVPEKKEIMFTGIQGIQHDHGAHAFLFGPDGKLYFNFGNSGQNLLDASGKVVKDQWGFDIRTNGRPYRQGMAFRCDLDGSNVETLGHNFRNNYEVTVDSFGTVWQSDNDDDGNRGVRINYVMEGGNYGYTDELSGAGWRTKRLGMKEDVPSRHWYQNDPGVIPNLLQTGQGAPTGILLYEGDLLPKSFQGQMIHCDPGPNVVRAYPVKNDGAGYSAEIIDIAKGIDKWYRPADVCIAADGSLFIADWYDGVVGGHNMVDRSVEDMRGRIYRVAPKGHKRNIPKVDANSTEGAIALLKSPNLARRYIGWQALHSAGAKAEAALRAIWTSDKKGALAQRHRARALHLLARLEGKTKKYVDEAIADRNSDIRITGLRIARQHKMDMIPYVRKLVRDPSSQVRRELSIALRGNKSAAAAQLWAALAMQHDGKDRWYLESLGLGAFGQEDRFFDAWLAVVGKQSGAAWARDVVWRSRAAKSATMLASFAADEKESEAARYRYVRALDFISGDAKNEALLLVVASGSSALSTEALRRLKGFDPKSNATHKEIVNRAVAKAKGTATYVGLVRQFGLEVGEPILDLAVKLSGTSAGADAARLLLERGKADLIESALAAAPVEAVKAARSLSGANDQRAIPLLRKIVVDADQPAALIGECVRGLAQSRRGAELLVKLAKDKKLPDEARSVAGVALSNVVWGEVRQSAESVLPPPPSKDNRPLPPISTLVKMKGNHESGAKVFDTLCSKCHVAGKLGKDFGPNLSEIGDKLGKDALFLNILDPNAGISFNYEGETLSLRTGDQVVGIVTSETGDSITIKTAEAIETTYEKKKILGRSKLSTSIMPIGLQRAMTRQELVDVVEFLTQLRKK